MFRRQVRKILSRASTAGAEDRVGYRKPVHSPRRDGRIRSHLMRTQAGNARTAGRCCDMTRNATIAEGAVSPSLIIRALDESALLTQRPDLRVAFVQWMGSRGFRPLSLLVEQCPTFGYTIEAHHRYLHVRNGVHAMELRRSGGEALIVHDMLPSLGQRRRCCRDQTAPLQPQSYSDHGLPIIDINPRATPGLKQACGM